MDCRQNDAGLMNKIPISASNQTGQLPSLRLCCLSVIPFAKMWSRQICDRNPEFGIMSDEWVRDELWKGRRDAEFFHDEG
jgi:hypothetical protein